MSQPPIERDGPLWPGYARFERDETEVEGVGREPAAELQDLLVARGEVVGDAGIQRLRAACPECGEVGEYPIQFAPGTTHSITGAETCQHCGEQFRIAIPPDAVAGIE